VDRDRPEPADRELDRERLDEPDLVDRVPLPPREPLPLEVFEAAVRFAILHTVVGLHHMSHFCHSGLFRDTSPPGPRRSGSAMLRTMVALFRSSTEPTRRGDTSSPIWQAMTLVDSGLVRLLGSLEVTGSFPPEMRDRPGLIAANHIGMFDPFVLTAVLRERGINPRFLLTAGLLDAPVVGWGLKQGDSIRVDRGKTNVTEAFDRVITALRSASGPVLVYPEGRISHDPGLWPERGKTGLARIALAANVPVMTISQWGAHEALYWGSERVNSWRDVVPVVGSGLRAIRDRPVFKVHFGPVVDLSDLAAGKPGDAVRAHKRIMQTITDGLVPLRRDEPDTPRFHDPTRPLDSTSPWRPKPPAN
jgi:1-acyl-sn-glycerol-3-phosphate acyltransferase